MSGNTVVATTTSDSEGNFSFFGVPVQAISDLLTESIASIIEVKEESDIDSFLSGGQVSFLSDTISGLDDFELICFLVIR